MTKASSPAMSACTPDHAIVTAGSHTQRLTHDERQGSQQVQGRPRPLEKWEEDDEAEGGEGVLSSSVMKDWLRTLDAYNFNPDAVPEPSMANFLGGTVSVSANRPGWQHSHSSVSTTAA